MGTMRQTPFPRRAARGGRAAATVAAGAALAAILVHARGAVREEVEDVAIPPPVRLRPAPNLGTGWTVILVAGRPGSYRAYVRRRVRFGRVVAREEIETRLVRAPRAEVRLVGTSPRGNPVSAPSLTRAVRAHRVLATAYDAGPLDNGPANAGITKLGWRTRRGIVAVDPAVIPLRSLLYVEGYGLAWAGDVGGAIRGARVDLCFNRTEEAVEWGRRRTTAYVLEGVAP